MNESEARLENQFRAIESALAESQGSAKPQKKMLPQWLIDNLKARYSELDWSTDEKVRANINSFQQSGPDSRRGGPDIR